MTNIKEILRKIKKELPKKEEHHKTLETETEEIHEIMQCNQLFSHPVFKEIEDSRRKNNG